MTTNWNAVHNWFTSGLVHADEAFLKKVNLTKEEYVEQLMETYSDKVLEDLKSEFIETDNEEVIADALIESVEYDVDLKFYLGEETYNLIATDIVDSAKHIDRQYPNHFKHSDQIRDAARREASRIIHKVAPFTTQPNFVRDKIRHEIITECKKLANVKSC